MAPTHLLLTHHHHDHVAENHVYKEKFGVEILAHPLEAERLMDVDRTIEPGETLEVGRLRFVALHTPGHTAGMLIFVVNGEEVFTGDTLFKGSVGGVRAPGSTSFEDLRHSIMDVLMKLPPETTIRPGPHRPDDGRRRVGAERLRPPLARARRGGHEHCTVEGEDATLVLWAPDYDGGHKAWVRWDSSARTTSSLVRASFAVSKSTVQVHRSWVRAG